MIEHKMVKFSEQSADTQRFLQFLQFPPLSASPSVYFFVVAQPLYLPFLLTSPFLTPLPLHAGARWSSNSVFREPAFTTSEANRQVSSAFCPTEGLPLFPSVLLSITAISNGFICRKPSVLHRVPLWATLASPSFLLPVFDVCQCSTSSRLLSMHFQDNWFTQR